MRYLDLTVPTLDYDSVLDTGSAEELEAANSLPYALAEATEALRHATQAHAAIVAAYRAVCARHEYLTREDARLRAEREARARAALDRVRERERLREMSGSLAEASRRVRELLPRVPVRQVPDDTHAEIDAQARQFREDYDGNGRGAR